MTGGKVSDEVIDAIAFIEMHRQEAEKESGTGAACAQALPQLQELFEQINGETTDPADVHAANIVAVTNDIARVKRLASGGQSNGNKHPRAGSGGGGGGHKKPPPRQYGQGGRPQGQGHPPAGQGQGQGPNHGHGPNAAQGRRRGRNKRRGGGGGGAAGGGAAGGSGNSGGGPSGAA